MVVEDKLHLFHEPLAMASIVGAQTTAEVSWESIFESPMVARTPSLGVNYIEASRPLKVACAITVVAIEGVWIIMKQQKYCFSSHHHTIATSL